MTSRPPKNVAASARARLLNRSRDTGEDFQFLLERYAAERFLYRLGESTHRDRYVLKGAMLYALLMRDGGRDFRTGEPIEAQSFFDDRIDIHHIFPEKWCKAVGIEPATYHCVINKTALAARTNRQIGGRAPSKYLPAIEKAAGVGTERMDEYLHSHCIAPEELRGDRFWEFYAARAEALVQRIEAATGKTISREPELFRAGVVVEAYDEGQEEWDAEEPIEETAS